MKIGVHLPLPKSGSCVQLACHTVKFVNKLILHALQFNQLLRVDLLGRLRKARVIKKLIGTRELCCIFHYVTASWSNRQQSYYLDRARRL